MPASVERSPLSSLVIRRMAELRRLLRQGDGKAARELLTLMPHFFKNAPDAFLLGYRAADLLALLSCAYRVVLLSRGKKVVVSVFNPEEKRHGFFSNRTCIQISAPDGPFYVTSVREQLRAMDHTVVHLIHPIIPVSWDPGGRLRKLGESNLPGRQSLIHIEIDRVDDRAQLGRIDRAVRQVFSDIHLVVRDFKKMRSVIHRQCCEFDAAAGMQKSSQFLHWLDSGNFVFLGYREYDLISKSGKKLYAIRRGSGLGLLRREKESRFFRATSLSMIPPAVSASIRNQDPFLIAQTNRASPIYRRERMVDLCVKKFDSRGRVAGSRRWIGLFTNRVEGLPAPEIPILKEKFRQVVQEEGAAEHSHDYREMYGIFSSYPKDFLFSTSVEDLRRDIRSAMAAQSSRDFKATFRPATVGSGISVMVILSKDKFSRDGRLRIEERLKRRLAATEIDYSLSMGAEDGEFARLYFSCATPRKTPVRGTFADLERELAELSKSWPDRLQEELYRRHGPKCGMEIFKVYGGAFSVEFHSHTSPSGAVHDIARLETLFASPAGSASRISASGASSVGVSGSDPAPQVPASLTRPIEIDLFNSKLDADCSRLKLYRLHEKLLLSDIMPILTDHGIRVVDEVSNSVRAAARPLAFIHTLRIQQGNGRVSATGAPSAGVSDAGRVSATGAPSASSLCESVRGCIAGQMECDPLCSLILLSRLSTREVALMRLYRNYIHQIFPAHTLRSIERALIRNPQGARFLVDLFIAKFSPSLGLHSSPAGSAPPAPQVPASLTPAGSAPRISASGASSVGVSGSDPAPQVPAPLAPARRKKMSAIRAAFEDLVDKVDDLVEDRILRQFLHAIESTVRTNYFQTPARRTIGIKIQSGLFPGMPKPAPLFEIFVYNTGFEGVHLRGGRISRGGIRHSDRRDDYRTEVLGLMKTQMVKNAIIVPDGAKGGFVVKSTADKGVSRPEVLACYRKFIRTLLDLTDNIIGPKTIHPVSCVMYDDADPYLVVAADKGTADFSDHANEIALDAGYWLGDAFASGGKNGYDHKKLAITARGVWECILHHLETIGHEKQAGKDERSRPASAGVGDAGTWGRGAADPETPALGARPTPEAEALTRPVAHGPLPVTCVGIGDMAGDVFGNGMLLSAGMRVRTRPMSETSALGARLTPEAGALSRPIDLFLLAAFNHQHIFLDPRPDRRRSHAERAKLFRMPRSTWADYDRRAISPGGGVYLRSSKKIVLSSQAAGMLGMSAPTASGEDVVRAILKMKVDLLYNGGIGTYVKASDEHHADVGDPSNDRVRVNASELRCRMVAEGGNNGLTQAARIEYAAAGGRINTDAVDNSAGVDLSDHEVNLKILLQALNVTGSRRLRILRLQTDPIVRAVLQNNASQSRILSIEEWRSAREMDYYPHLLDILSGAVGLSREIEGLPSDKQLAERAKLSRGLLRPELAVILAYVKICIARAISTYGRVSASGAPSAGVSGAGRVSRSAAPSAGVSGSAAPRPQVPASPAPAGAGRVLADDPIFGHFLAGYFPPRITRAYRSRLARHRLADLIVSNRAADTFVNRAGLTMAFRLAEDCGVSLAVAVRAYMVSERLVCVECLRDQMSRICAGAVAVDMLDQSLASIARWILKEYREGDPAGVGDAGGARTWGAADSGGRGADPAGVLRRFHSIPKLMPRIESLLSESARREFQNCIRTLTEKSVPTMLARKLAEIKMTLNLLELQAASARLQIEASRLTRAAR